jgi:hypothetical protein
MTETKTRPGTSSVAAFIAAIPDDERRRDARALSALMSRITHRKPKMWGDSIVGFGSYHYRYDSGHEGDSCLVGFAARRSEFSIYLTGTYFPEQGTAREELLRRLGRHRVGKACLYIRRLSEIDTGVLEELVRMSVDGLTARYASK